MAIVVLFLVSSKHNLVNRVSTFSDEEDDWLGVSLFEIHQVSNRVKAFPFLSKIQEVSLAVSKENFTQTLSLQEEKAANLLSSEDLFVIKEETD